MTTSVRMTHVVQQLLYVVHVPRVVDEQQRRIELSDATLAVVARHGVAGVTIRRVAAELGRSTATITHYTPDRRSLLDAAVATALDRRRVEAEQVVAAAVDPLRALLAWSVG
ncbi:MAG TPA: TetR family transcriptional regulator, partial [Acidimicrobiales bacterium]|nr:TetR family transcriptional regulator [Acidimicrobiales bacterium]